MSETASMEDRLAIRELIEANADAVMRNDAAAFAATFARDATLILPIMGIAATGRDAIARAQSDAMTKVEFAGIFPAAAPVKIDGGHASGLSYQQEFIFMKDGTKSANIGQYADEYVKQDGRWYFQKRTHGILSLR